MPDLARYRPMLENNKANWESFDPGGEVNHAWTSYPGYIFLKYICGIQPTSGGFATFDVRPETGGLTFAEGTVPTVKGLITTRWEKGSDGSFSLAVHVPANTQGSVYIPKLSGENVSITESGKHLGRHPKSMILEWLPFRKTIRLSSAWLVEANIIFARNKNLRYVFPYSES